MLKRTLIILSLFAGLLGCKQEADCGFVQNVYGQRISWKNSEPIILRLHKSFPEKYIPSVEAAMEVWNFKAERKLFALDKLNKVSGPLKPQKDGANIIYMMSNWEKDRAFEQARTSVYWKGDSIEEADIRLNSNDFKFYTTEGDDRALATADEMAIHVKSLFVHELGHVLGLKHNESKTSVMASFLQPHKERTVLAVEDQASLRCEY